MRIEPSKLLEDKKYCESVFTGFVKEKIVRKTEPSTFERHVKKSIDNLDLSKEEIKFIIDKIKLDNKL